MRLRISIALSDEAQLQTPDADLVHRFRNFGEELYREFSTSGHAEMSLDEIDAATREVHVHVKAKRHLGAVTAFIKKTLQRHGLDDQFALSRD